MSQGGEDSIDCFYTWRILEEFWESSLSLVLSDLVLAERAKGRRGGFGQRVRNVTQSELFD